MARTRIALRPASALVGLVLALVFGVGLTAQQPPRLDQNGRTRAKEMLEEIKAALKRDYYDPRFHGLDLNQHFKTAQAKIENAVSQGHAYAIIAQALIDLNDSHTFFIPPDYGATFDYGWRLSIVQDSCYVAAVKPGSDAATKGVKPGDKVLQLDAFTPDRDQFWKAEYLIHVLSPRRALKAVIQAPDAPPRPVEIAARVTPRAKEERVSLDALFEGGAISFGKDAPVRVSRAARAGDVSIWKLETFEFDPADVDAILDAAIGKGTALVLDLRDNGGGEVKTLQQVVSRLFDRDVKIGDEKGRKSSKAVVAKKGKRPFTGKLAVIVDASSASAAEVLARVVQLEKRGTVIGDRSAGSVMAGVFHAFAIDVSDASDVALIPYGASITQADLLMSDGHSLEQVGVTPDEIVLPTANDLRTRRDPALARAVTLLGGSLSPEEAGALFPPIWR